ncbi:hypothetical protein GOBAR_DD01674 [Gossypium barbadense]|nr:hypothetical protein GOBAR_DD01674 [Gossypium barbadense]
MESERRKSNDSRMQGFRPSLRAVVLIIALLWVVVVTLYGLLKPISNGCVMTYMYPTYIPISTAEGVLSAKYGLYLYHEGWRNIDFKEHLKNLKGVPVLFIPGNGGSYKQARSSFLPLLLVLVRSLAAESERAYQGGALEHTFYREAYLTSEEGGNADVNDFQLPNQYANRLDWFSVDLEGEHSAMDGRILEEHTEYVVYAIHRILDQYKESHDAREREGAAITASLPKSVILIGHSMGGFVARAATVHPHLRKSTVETILTLSSPHQSPPVALQPSLGHYYESINQEWRQGYDVQTAQTGEYVSSPKLSHVVIVSISGGYNDYQVRSKLESLDGIVPPTHGFMIGSTSMKNVWLSMEHQAICWCNQLVVQVSHTLLSLIDSRRGQPLSDTQKRLAILSKMLRSGIQQSFKWRSQLFWSTRVPFKDVKYTAVSQDHTFSDCPSSVHWSDDVPERDLYIQKKTVNILAMDGRRRWLDILELGSNEKSHFIFVTNLAPCSGVRVHLWPQKGNLPSDLPAGKSVLEVTSKMVQIPAGQAPRQIEPGSQTEQASPSALLHLGPEEMHGFRYLTISVAPHTTISGSPPTTSMAIGQFFNPDEGEIEFSPISMLSSRHFHEDIIFKEDHPLAFNLSFAINLGLLPVTFSLKTTSCGIKGSGLLDEGGDMDNTKLCKQRCFPPIAFAWDPTSGLQIFPNLYSETLVVDSSPALWTSTGAEKTVVLLLLFIFLIPLQLDPNCSYKASLAVSVTKAASRYLLLYCPKMFAFNVAVLFFALMRQAHERPIPSILKAVETNLRIPFPFFPLAVLHHCVNNLLPIIKWVYNSTDIDIRVGLLCGCLFTCFHEEEVVRILRARPLFVPIFMAIILSTFVHPALGLLILLFSHALCCHSFLCNSLTASLRSNVRKKEVDDRSEGNCSSQQVTSQPGSPSKENRPSYSQAQEDIFHQRHGLLVLHLVAALMLGPSLVSWLQRIGMHKSFPRFLDSLLCICMILHGIFSSESLVNSSLPFPRILGQEMSLSFIYLIAGIYCYLSGLNMVPYKAMYAMGAVSIISFTSTVVQVWTGAPSDRGKWKPRRQ